MDKLISVYRLDLDQKLISGLIEVYIACFTGPPRFETWTTDSVKTHIESFLACGADFFIIEHTGRVAAFAIGITMRNYFNKSELLQQGAREESYYFAELGTHPDFRGKGYGSLLHEAREEVALANKHAWLNVRVRSDNDINIKLLGRRGFKLVGRYTGTIQGSESTRLIMEKALL